MLITKPSKYSISTWYKGIGYNGYVYKKYGEMLALLELDECGSTLSLSVYDSNSERGFDTQSVRNATIELWNENVLIFKGAIGRVGGKQKMSVMAIFRTGPT